MDQQGGYLNQNQVQVGVNYLSFIIKACLTVYDTHIKPSQIPLF